MDKLKALFSLFKETFDEWNADNAPRLAAALSYYTIFSIAPFLIVVIAIAGAAFGQEAVQGSLDEQIQGVIGREGADMIQELVVNSRKPADNIIATVIGVATLLMGAGGVFGQLKGALNEVWDVVPQPGGSILNTIKERFLSFSMVLGVGFLLMVSLTLSTIITLVQHYVTGLLPGTEFVLQVVNFVVSFGIITVLFAMMFKVLPDAEVQWHDVWIGAAVTALLFTIGKTALGIYLGNSGVASSYGAAGSLILILLWIFYSSQILLFGAEFTQVYARKYGSKIIPESYAVAEGETALPEDAKDASNPIPTPQIAVPVASGAYPQTAGVANPVMYPDTTEPSFGTKLMNWLKAPITVGAALLGLVIGVILGGPRDAESSKN